MSELNTHGRLLIIDDSVANISLLRNILNRLGFTHIESTTDSRETLRHVESFRPDLIILDLNMPHLDGFAVLQQLARILPPGTYLPVLVLTADATGETKRKALAAGASDLITKPFNSSEVFMRLRNLLQIRFLHLQLHTRNVGPALEIEDRKLNEAQQQRVVQERLSAFGEIAGGIAHDFNNALMLVIGYSDMLIHDDAVLGDPKKAREYLQIINTAGQDASELISRWRDFYLLKERADGFVRVDLNEVVEQVVSLTQSKLKKHRLSHDRTIAVEMDLARLPPISGLVADLKEAATNLILNAVDAMPAGGTITLRTSSETDQAVLEVTDTGTGMSDEVRRRCLEPFFTTKGEHASGLGLSMVSDIIKRHEGTVAIESLSGGGTTFRICLPRQPSTSNSVGDRARCFT